MFSSKKINYIAAIVLTIFWAVGSFTHKAGYSIHFLLIGALVLIFMTVIEDDNSPKNINH